MALSDPLADMLERIRRTQAARHKTATGAAPRRGVVVNGVDIRQVQPDFYLMPTPGGGTRRVMSDEFYRRALSAAGMARATHAAATEPDSA